MEKPTYDEVLAALTDLHEWCKRNTRSQAWVYGEQRVAMQADDVIARAKGGQP